MEQLVWGGAYSHFLFWVHSNAGSIEGYLVEMTQVYNDVLHPADNKVLDVLIKNRKLFRAYLARKVGDEATADDILQSAVKKALENPAHSNEDRGIKAWFYSILKTSLIDHFRGQASEERKHERFLHQISVEGRTVERSLDDLEEAICKCIDGLLPTLKDSYAELIQRIDLGDESIGQVAKDLGITENNLNVKLHRARQALKVSLERTCGVCTQHGCLDCSC